MFDRVRVRVLRVLRVPHDPDPPAGAPGSVRVFRAGKNLYKLRVVGWGFGQIGALIGIGVSLWFLGRFEQGVDEARTQIIRETTAARAAELQKASPAPPLATTPPAEAAPAKKRVDDKKAKARKSRNNATRKAAERFPLWLFPLLNVLEWSGIVLYLVQIPVTFAMVRLDFEMRWYIVTDRSLRIRTGLASVQEMTMSFANVQQVVVSQGPLQRALGVADIRVQSAGGGAAQGASSHGGAQVDSLHTGVFHGVENASEIRDLILERLRQFRQAGLGDPDDRHAASAPIEPPLLASPSGAAIDAARELLAEARALRQSVS